MSKLKENYSKGKKGEELVISYLKNLNYSILEVNYRTPIGEIDIIALDENILVFVEVKSRKSRKYGEAAEAVNMYKQQKIINTAMLYLQSKGYTNIQSRFDVVEVYYIGNGEINHFQNAFILE